MSHCCHHNEITKPPRSRLNNLAYLELCSKVEEIKSHAEREHKKEQWKCKYLFHDWREFMDQECELHKACHRCGKYQYIGWRSTYT